MNCDACCLSISSNWNRPCTVGSQWWVKQERKVYIYIYIYVVVVVVVGLINVGFTEVVPTYIYIQYTWVYIYIYVHRTHIHTNDLSRFDCFGVCVLFSMSDRCNSGNSWHLSYIGFSEAFISCFCSENVTRHLILFYFSHTHTPHTHTSFSLTYNSLSNTSSNTSKSLHGPVSISSWASFYRLQHNC